MREKLRGFRIQLQAGARVIDRLHPREEFGIEINRILMRRQQRRDFALLLVDRRIAVGLLDIEKGLVHAIEHPAGALHRHNGVLKSRRRGVGRDGVNFRPLFFHALGESRRIIAVLDLVELGGVKRQRAWAVEWPSGK